MGKNKNLFLLKQEEKNVNNLIKIINNIRDEVNLIIDEIKTKSLNLESFEEYYDKKLIEITDKINSEINKVTFNFTKLLISKDLRRNAAYLQILITFKRITKLSLDFGYNLHKIFNRKIIASLEETKAQDFVLSMSNILVSLLNETSFLIEEETIEKAESILKDSNDLKKSLKEYRDIIDLNVDMKNISEKQQIKNLYNFFKIINDFENLSDDIDVIAQLIIYINNGSFKA